MKGFSELKSLSPWTWDARVEDHPPGEASMRDFRDQFSLSSERPTRRSTQTASTPGSTAVKRRARGATKDDFGSSRKKPAKDKENRSSPANTPADVSEPQSATTPKIASPAFLTPARFNDVSHDDVAVNANASTVSKDAARQPSTSTSTHTGFAAGTPKIDDAPRSAAARAAVHAEFIKQHRARTRLGNPAFSTPVISGPVNGHVKSPAEQLSQADLEHDTADTGNISSHSTDAVAVEVPATSSDANQSLSGLVTATDASVLTSVLNAGRTFTSSAADNATSSASNATLQQHMRALSPAGPAQQTDAMPDSEHDTHAAANDHETVTAKASGTPSDQGKLLPTAIASGEASKIQAVASITASANTMLQPGDAAASEHQLQSAQHAVVEPVTQLPEAHLALCPVTNSMQNASLSSLEPAVTLTCPSAAQPPQDMSDQEVLLPTQGKPVLDVARTNALQSPSQSATPSDATAVRHHADGACGPAVMPVPINAEVAAVSQGPVHLSKAAPSIVSITQPDDSSQRRADTAMGAEPTSALLAMDDKGEVNVKETTAPGMHHLQHIGCDSMLEPIAQDADMLNQADAQGFDMTDQAHAQDVDMAEQSHTCDKAHARRLPGTLATDTGHGAAVPTSLPSSGKPATVSAVPKQASRQLCDQRAVQHSQHSPDRPALHAVAPSVRSQQPTSSTITDAAPHALASQHLQKQPFGAAVMQQQSFPARQHATVATRRQQQDQLQGSQRAVITRHQYQLSDLHKLQRQVASAAVRQNSRWPNAKVTSMSLRSKKRKHSSWSSDQDSIGEERVVTRGSERRKGLGAYATRSRGHVASVVSPELRRTDGRHDRVRRTGLASAGLATQSSSDLAAAEALKALRNTDEEAEGHEAMSQDEHDQPMQSAELATSFAPPVPLWVEGPSQTRPAMAVPVTAVPVLPRHHQAATESALTMLANASPLSGLHKLAVSICARKKGPLCSTLETNPPMLTDNANPVTPLLDLSAPSDKATLTTPRDKSSKAGTKSSMSHSTGILPGTAVAAPGTSGSHASKATVSGAMAVLSSTDAAVKSGKVATGEVAVRPVKVPRTWDQYVAAQLQAGPDKQRQAKLVALLKKELARPGLSLLARACLLLRLEDAEAGLLYSQYHAVLAACTAQKLT